MSLTFVSGCFGRVLRDATGRTCVRRNGSVRKAQISATLAEPKPQDVNTPLKDDGTLPPEFIGKDDDLSNEMTMEPGAPMSRSMALGEMKWEVQTDYKVVDEKTGLPLRYDGKTIREYWDKKPMELQSRWTYFLGIVVPFGTKLFRNLTVGTAEKNAAELASDFRTVLEKLGPTFVKLGQVLSIRPDIVGNELSDELQKLQDSVPVFPTEVARKLIEEELGQPLEEVFSEFSEEPIGAASLAQVYRARLRSNGMEVAVKVQRPGLLPIVTKDLYVMRRAVEWFEPIRKRFSAERTDYMELLNTWASGFYEELDFYNEAYNQKQFKELLEKSGIKNVKVPEVLLEYSTRRILVSEFVSGVKLTRANDGDIQTLIDIGNEAFLTQLLDWGVFHGDPHPGNLMVTEDGQLCILDFGLMASIPEEDRDIMVSAVIHVANKDFGQLVDDLIKLKFLPMDVDRAKVEQVMGKVMGPFVYSGGGAKNVDFRSLARDLAGTTREIPFSIPPYYALVGRALITLEGIALQAYPDYRLVMEAYPYVARRVMTEGDTPELQRALAEILYTNKGFSISRLIALLNSAMGYVGMSKDSIVDLDAIPDDGAQLSNFTEFLLRKESKSVRDTLSTELARAADIFCRRLVLVRTNEIMSSLLRVPAPFRFGYDSVKRANELSSISKEEELYADSMAELFTQLTGVQLKGVLNDPSGVITVGQQLAGSEEIQKSIDVVRKNSDVAEAFATQIGSELQTIGTKRFVDEFLPVAWPGVAPVLKRQLAAAGLMR